MTSAKALRAKTIARIDADGTAERDDWLAVEEPLEIRVGGRSVAVVMRTPGHDRELAAGFLVSEGIVRGRDDLLDLVRCRPGNAENRAVTEATARENILEAVLAPGVSVDLERLTRHLFTSSSCGVCSKATIEAVNAQFPPLTAETSADAATAPARFRVELLRGLPAKLQAAQDGFAVSGGLHASGLFDAEGMLLVAREDVGRHNALDKVIGHAFLNGRWPLSACVLLVSGRVSFEIVQKALAARIPCIAAISAPTSAAVELAWASGQTLVGFLRGERMNVYAGTLAE